MKKWLIQDFGHLELWFSALLPSICGFSSACDFIFFPLIYSYPELLTFEWVVFNLLIWFFQVDGNHIEEVLSRNQRFGYVSVLFYASWCPFSQSLLPKLEKLSSIFPQVEHLVVEQSSTLPRFLNSSFLCSWASVRLEFFFCLLHAKIMICRSYANRSYQFTLLLAIPFPFWLA